jgi:hypothetical protein
MTIKTPLSLIRDARYERMIRKSQANVAQTTLVPGYTKIYA